nr:hypothetical protein [Tanacetum cinerariifolium]
MDINIDALYNILNQNQGDVNDAMGSKKKTIMVTSDPLALIAEKTKVSKSKEKVVVSSDSEGSQADDFSELKKITALLAKAFNRRNFYSKPTNNNLRTSSTSQSANKKQDFVKNDNKKVEKKDDEKKRDISRVKCYNCKKEGHFVKDCKKVKVKDYEYYKTKMLLAKDKDKQVLLAEDQAWMESSSDLDQEINANMVFMAQIEKVLSDSETSSSFADEKIFEDVGKLKAKGDIEVFVGYSKESAAFIIYNKQTRKIHESVNVNFDEISEMASKQFNFYDEYFDSSKIMKSSTTNVETPINEEVFHEFSESFQGESSLSSLNEDVQQSPEEVILPSSNTQSIPINMVPNGDEASTSHNVFNERLEDAYIDATLRDADQEELDQFARLKVWRLVPRPEGKSVIKTKWIIKNKKDESSLVI